MTCNEKFTLGTRGFFLRQFSPQTTGKKRSRTQGMKKEDQALANL